MRKAIITTITTQGKPMYKIEYFDSHYYNYDYMQYASMCAMAANMWVHGSC